MTFNNPLEDDPIEIPRKVMTLFFLVDTSSSMCGSKIEAVNTAARETLPIIKEISVRNANSKIKIAALEFSSAVEWMYTQPIDVDNFQWRDLEASGLTCLGGAYIELSKQLSASHGFMKEETGTFSPVLLLMTDGEPTDDANYGLQKLKSNKWFQVATKIAIAIGNDANQQTLIDFTGTSEAVLTVHNIDQLKKIIQIVSVNASRVNSQNASVGSDAPSKRDDTIKKIKEDIANDPTLVILTDQDDPVQHPDDWDQNGEW